MRIANNTLISAPVDLSTAWESGAIYLGHIAMYSVQLVFTGATIDGEFKLQGSNDEGSVSSMQQPVIQAEIVNWSDIGGSPVTVNAAGDILYNVEEVAYKWVKVVWTPGTTVGTLDSARFNLKGV